MLRFSEKLKYMVFGGLLTFAGFLLGTLNTDPQAQSGYEKIDRLVVGELKVLKELTVVNNRQEPQVILSWDQEGGSVAAYGQEGIGVAALSLNKKGGTVTVRGRKGKSGAGLSVTEHGGSVNVFSVKGTLRAAVAVQREAGVVYLIDDADNSRVLKTQ